MVSAQTAIFGFSPHYEHLMLLTLVCKCLEQLADNENCTLFLTLNMFENNDIH